MKTGRKLIKKIFICFHTAGSQINITTVDIYFILKLI